MFDEGLAAFLQEEERWLGYTVDAWAQAFSREGMLFPLEVIFSFSDIGSEETRPLISYPQAASIVKYLVETHGWEKYLQLFRELRSSEDAKIIQANHETFLRVTGVSVKETEKDWLELLEKRVTEKIPQDTLLEIKIRYKNIDSTL
jgi:hypothetical protein